MKVSQDVRSVSTPATRQVNADKDANIVVKQYTDMLTVSQRDKEKSQKGTEEVIQLTE